MALRIALAALLLAACGHAGARVPAGASAAPPAPAAGAIPFKRDKAGGDAAPYQALAGVVLAGLAAYGVVLALKRHGGKGLPGAAGARAERRLRVLESVRVGRRGMLHVVAYRGRELLFTEGEHGLVAVPLPPAEDADA
ncbi:MAG: hypothetical protein ACXU8N_08640 [Telluria sp.]